jgi:hypothetical protein
MRRTLLLCAVLAADCLAGTAGGALRSKPTTFTDLAGDSDKAPDVTRPLLGPNRVAPTCAIAPLRRGDRQPS